MKREREHWKRFPDFSSSSGSTTRLKENEKVQFEELNQELRNLRRNVVLRPRNISHFHVKDSTVCARVSKVDPPSILCGLKAR